MDEYPNSSADQNAQVSVTSKTSKRKIILIVAIFLIIIIVVGFYLFLNKINLNNNFLNNLSTQPSNNSTTSTTSSTENPTTETTTTRIVPLGIGSATEALSACNNNCKELGYDFGTCLFGNVTNFTCTNSTLGVGISLNPRPTTDWCAFFTINEITQTNKCCCYT